MRSFIVLLAALLTTVALAIDPPKPASERPDIADDAQEAAAKEAAAKAEAEARAVDEEVLPPLPADMVPAGPPPARFNPTEKVRADFPVSFPIDI
jgi:hypothetical protein